MVSGALRAWEGTPAHAGHRGTGPEAPAGLVAAGGPWRGPTGRRGGRLVPAGDGTLRPTPSREHGGRGVTLPHSTLAAAALGPADDAGGGGHGSRERVITI